MGVNTHICPYAYLLVIFQTKEKSPIAGAWLWHRLMLTDYGYNLPFGLFHTQGNPCTILYFYPAPVRTFQ